MGKEKSSFINYRASAGSGKTYRLVLEYLSLALQKVDNFKHILAITFTNKAAAEMKERILRSLKELATGENSTLRSDLLTHEPSLINIEKQAGKVLKKILHSYSNFAVTTIDSFINRLVRSFTYETDIPAGFDVELNFNRMNNTITRNLLADIGVDPDTTRVILDFALRRIGEGKSWKVNREIIGFLKEFNNEKQQDRLDQLAGIDPRDFLSISDGLRRTFSAYTEKMKKLGEKGVELIESNGFSINDFPWNYSGAAGHLNKLCGLTFYSLKETVPGSRFKDGTWTVKGSSNRLISAMEGKFGEKLRNLHQEIMTLFEEEFSRALTAKLIFENVTLLGLVGGIRHYFNRYKSELNVVPIYDLTRNVHTLIGTGDIPFIYYMLGDSFEHIMIDEFQDTSQMQWDSLFPLIENSVAVKKKNLGVGDLKQSIYRWRGGVTDIMDRDIHEQFQPWGGVEVINLPDNYRSRRNIVEFNNRLFGSLGTRATPNPFLPAIYDQAVQNPRRGEGGFVSVTFINKEEDKLPEQVLSAVERCLEAGFRPGDIAVISRRKRTGMEIADKLVESGHDIVTPELLELRQNPVSLFLINLLKLVHNPSQNAAMADILFFLEEHFDSGVWDPSRTEVYFSGRDTAVLPECVRTFVNSRNLFLRLPLYESVEEMIRMFSLTRSTASGSGGYISAFLDMINDYSAREGGSIPGFLTWWEEYGTDYSVAIPEEVNGVILMTIHKAKGLEFPVVILPDTDWQGKNDPVWLDPDPGAKPFDAYPPPYFVTHKSVLSESRLSRSYREEEFRRELDDLNLFYVACTRPREALFIFSEGKEAGEGKHSNGGMLRELTASEFLAEKGESLYELGKLENLLKKPQESVKETIPDEQLISNRWSEKMTIGMRSEKFWQLIPDEQLEKMDRGILIHEVLSRITADRGPDDIIGQMTLAGRITAEEGDEVLQAIAGMFESQEVEGWFFGPGEHITEHPVITNRGVYRPDRVILQEGTATIIDFKTGIKSDKDLEQMWGYKSILAEMGYGEVKGVLYYLSSGETVEV